MAKTEWGAKRTCHSCGARFYDLGHKTIVCPTCNTVYDPERQSRTRRSGGAVKDEAVAVARAADDAAKKKVEPETAGDNVIDEDGVDAKVPEEGGGEGEIDEIKAEDRDLIEDTSDLGEDDDDIGEVMEHVDEDVEDKT